LTFIFIPDMVSLPRLNSVGVGVLNTILITFWRYSKMIRRSLVMLVVLAALLFAFGCGSGEKLDVVTGNTDLDQARNAAGVTWTVDDDGVDFPGADFTHPQDAVNAASEGDTIVVYPGTYGSRYYSTPKPPHWSASDQWAPALIVYKDNLTIQAYDPDPSKTVIESTHELWSNPVAIQASTGGVWNGSSYENAGVYPSGGTSPNAIIILASGVTIEGFTLHRHFEGTYATYNTAGVMIGGLCAGDVNNLGAASNTVRNCYFSDVWHAVFIWHSSGNKVYDNEVASLSTNHWAAISVNDGDTDAKIQAGYLSTDNLIYANTIANKGISIGAWPPPTWTDNSGNIIAGNICTQIGTHHSEGRKLFTHNTTWAEVQINPSWITNASGVVGVDGVIYDGALLFSVNPQLTLSATIDFNLLQLPEDGSGFEVEFALGGDTFSGSTDGNGNCSLLAGFDPPLAPGFYTVDVEAIIWETEGYSYSYTDCVEIEIVANTDSSAWLSGGGWIQGYYDDKAFFNMNPKYKGGLLEGKFSYSDGDFILTDDIVNWLSFVGDNEAYFGGTGWIAYVEDNGEPGKQVDILRVYFSDGSYDFQDTLGGGNIQAHN
jgi:hypothetical protein